jgi:hypothetical protein
MLTRPGFYLFASSHPSHLARPRILPLCLSEFEHRRYLDSFGDPKHCIERIAQRNLGCHDFTQKLPIFKALLLQEMPV